MLIIVDILIVVLLLYSSFCWFKSAKVKFKNESGTILSSTFGEHITSVTNPNEVKEFVAEQAKWNAKAAISAALAALITGVLMIIKLIYDL